MCPPLRARELGFERTTRVGILGGAAAGIMSISLALRTNGGLSGRCSGRASNAMGETGLVRAANTLAGGALAGGGGGIPVTPGRVGPRRGDTARGRLLTTRQLLRRDKLGRGAGRLRGESARPARAAAVTGSNRRGTDWCIACIIVELLEPRVSLSPAARETEDHSTSAEQGQKT